MARIGLILVLALATAVGPWLCCCTAAFLSALPAKVAAPPAPANEPAAPCCCHTASTDNSPPAEPNPAPGPSCPCEKNRPQNEKLWVSDHSTAEQLARLLVLLDRTETLARPCTLSFSDLDAQGQPARESIVLPFQEPRDLLRALHLLLC